MSKQVFLNRSEDCDWLREVHLKPLNLHSHAFRSFVLFGNEDCPNEVRLYSSRDPLVSDKFQKIIFEESKE